MAVSICQVETDQREKEMALHGRGSFPVACYEDDMQVVKVPIHWHDEYEYIVSVKGDVTVCLGGEEILLQEGDSLFINSGCLHGVKSVDWEESVLRSLVILPKFIGGSSDSYIWQKLLLPFQGQKAPAYLLLNSEADWQKKLTKSMLSAWDAITGESYDYENEARFLISRAMRILVDHLTEMSFQYHDHDPVLHRMKMLLSYIDTHYMEDIGNPDLMELCHCSESVLLRSFRQVIGTSPIQYLLQVRIQKAAEMLLTTNEKSYGVALACGFRDVSYFTKMFKRYMGATPMEYRKRIGN